MYPTPGMLGTAPQPCWLGNHTEWLGSGSCSSNDSTCLHCPWPIAMCRCHYVVGMRVAGRLACECWSPKCLHQTSTCNCSSQESVALWHVSATESTPRASVARSMHMAKLSSYIAARPAQFCFADEICAIRIEITSCISFACIWRAGGWQYNGWGATLLLCKQFLEFALRARCLQEQSLTDNVWGLLSTQQHTDVFTC